MRFYDCKLTILDRKTPFTSTYINFWLPVNFDYKKYHKNILFRNKQRHVCVYACFSNFELKQLRDSDDSIKTCFKNKCHNFIKFILWMVFLFFDCFFFSCIIVFGLHCIVYPQYSILRSYFEHKISQNFELFTFGKNIMGWFWQVPYLLSKIVSFLQK